MQSSEMYLDFAVQCLRNAFFPVGDINFKSAKKMKQDLDGKIDLTAEDQELGTDNIKKSQCSNQLQNASQNQLQYLSLHRLKWEPMKN